MTDVETIVIGAGAVGLAIARALAVSGREVMVLERHGLIGSETSSRNSEVIHAGIYYAKDSLKARCCVHGKHLLYAFCSSHGVAHKRTGKLIVATDVEQADKLEEIRQRAEANGVDDLVRLTADEARELEPELACEGALLSPSTGIIDSHGYMLALQGELEAHGGQVVLNTAVGSIGRTADGAFSVTIVGKGDGEGEDGYTITSKELIVSAGRGSPELMTAFPQADPPKGYLAKGSYFKLNGKAPFSRLIYPVPMTKTGALGVHVTLDLQGRVRFGPDMEWVEEIDYRVDPARADVFYDAIRQYWPGLEDGALEADYSGIRPKIHGPGEPAPDFRIDGPEAHGMAGLVALYGIESPGLTSSLAIGELVAKRLG
ncbi:NAD(P)/FAD-dependent oxidoreductase [Roseibium aggregatum]|uniref:NAD(P)/FAD-dependent oxidoreductase n=1 Tax=Roseibium aggregatum TaxID=187304 RepID=A0A926NVG6_9HYPH|nr:NAD(P)/FAD-dependent oxidoreductase [Roseibium aggregatum]MBD1545984.1 NAD(P)/FAD-dependent oxidoreductase [Roseibium aggregatum]